MEKKGLLRGSELVLTGLLLGSTLFGYDTGYSKVLTSKDLQAKIQTLQVTVNKLNAQIASMKKQIAAKDASIKKMQQDIAKKDKIIKDYQSKYIMEPSTFKLAKDGFEVTRSYTVGNTSVPSTVTYKNIVYAPVPLMAELFHEPVTLKNKTWYVGSFPEGQYMSDILEPYITTDATVESNTQMVNGWGEL
jgi:cell division protein FtsB